MDKSRNKTVMILALISIFLCACPGCLLLFPGFVTLAGAMGNVQNIGDLLYDVLTGLSQGGWLVCLGGFLILIPLGLAIIAVVQQDKPVTLEDLTPTGASKDDPLPPPS